jgi:hypothetical protein
MPRDVRMARASMSFLETFQCVNKFMVGEDWNAKHTNWESRLMTPEGRNLLQSITNYNCSCLPTGEPTYWPSDPNKTPDLLDFFFFKSIATNYIQIEANFTFMVLCIINGNTE